MGHRMSLNALSCPAPSLLWSLLPRKDHIILLIICKFGYYKITLIISNWNPIVHLLQHVSKSRTTSNSIYIIVHRSQGPTSGIPTCLSRGVMGPSEAMLSDRLALLSFAFSASVLVPKWFWLELVNTTSYSHLKSTTMVLSTMRTGQSISFLFKSSST